MRIESSTVSMWSNVGNSANIGHAGSTLLSFEDYLKSSRQGGVRHISVEVRKHEEHATVVNIISRRNQVRITEVRNNEIMEVDIDDIDKQRLLVLKELLEQLTGKKVKFYARSTHNTEFEGIRTISFGRGSGNTLNVRINDTMPSNAIPSSDRMNFGSSGVVKTLDGRTIDFSVNLNLVRSTDEGIGLEIDTSGQTIDPLVINFASNSAWLAGTEFNFDLNLDGTDENLNFVGEGSGFLAIDLNSDGMINDGGELFGPESGSGFEDLAVYDLDENSWIDENDSVFQSLRIWTKDSEGRDSLFSLNSKGIGAIYLGSAGTEFEQEAGDAVIRETGIFLREDGTAGTIQDIDYIV